MLLEYSDIRLRRARLLSRSRIETSWRANATLRARGVGRGFCRARGLKQILDPVTNLCSDVGRGFCRARGLKLERGQRGAGQARVGRGFCRARGLKQIRNAGGVCEPVSGAAFVALED